MTNKIMQFFSHEHLTKGPHKDVSKEISLLAFDLEKNLPDGPEKSAGMRKLLEAKDCFVRSTFQ